MEKETEDKLNKMLGIGEDWTCIWCKRNLTKDQESGEFSDLCKGQPHVYDWHSKPPGHGAFVVLN